MNSSWILEEYRARDFDEGDRKGKELRGKYGPVETSIEPEQPIHWVAGDGIISTKGYVSLDYSVDLEPERFVCFVLAEGQTFSVKQGEGVFTIATSGQEETFRFFDVEQEYMPDVERLRTLVNFVDERLF